MTRTGAIRFAALVLAAIVAGFTLLTYYAYTTGFRSTDPVFVTSPRAGLVMEKGAKVKYRGIQIGKVTDIRYMSDQAQLTLAIDRDQLGHVPSDAGVRIASTTVFGGKSVEFIPPKNPPGTRFTPLRPETHVQVQPSDVQLEVNTLFQTLVEVLHKLDPVHLNATLTALSDGLRGHGDDFGATLAGLNQYLSKLNPKLSTVQSDIQQTGVVANIYGDAGPDLAKLIDNVPTINNTIVDEQDNLNASLMAAIGLANNGYATLAPAQDNLIAAIQRLRAPLKVLGDYSPEFGCLLQAIKRLGDRTGQILGGIKPGAIVSSDFVLGVPSYTYPESLPIVNASGGPNCRGLPDLPSKQFGGSWFHTPFVVTDNAYIPYEPFTEVQVDAPSTFQFLFNGAFAERDAY